MQLNFKVISTFTKLNTGYSWKPKNSWQALTVSVLMVLSNIFKKSINYKINQSINYATGDVPYISLKKRIAGTDTVSLSPEPEEGPPVPPGRGVGAHACSGASCCVGEPFWAHQNAKNLLVAGAPPQTPLGELTALLQTS